MAHPQSSPRGLFGKKAVYVGAQLLTDGTTYLSLSAGVRISGLAGGVLTADATHLILAGGIKLSASAAGGALTADASNLIVPVGIKIGNVAGGALTATATALAIPEGLALKSLTTAAAPGTRYGPGAIAFLINSTAKTLVLNTTGTTWRYIVTTAVQAVGHAA